MIHDPPTLRSFSRDHAREPPTIANLVSRETHFYHVSEIPMATFTSMQEIVSKNNIGRRYTRFVSRGKCALLRDNTLLCGRRAGYVMVVGRFEKLIHTSELRIKPLSAISYIIVYIYISNGDISLFIYAHWAFSLFIGEGLRKKRSIFNDSLSMYERNFLDHAYERSSPRSLLMNGERRVFVWILEKSDRSTRVILGWN